MYFCCSFLYVLVSSLRTFLFFCGLEFVEFHLINTHTQTHTYIYIKYILVWFGFMVYQSLLFIFIPNTVYTYISNIRDLVLLVFMAYQTLEVI